MKSTPADSPKVPARANGHHVTKSITTTSPLQTLLPSLQHLHGMIPSHTPIRSTTSNQHNLGLSSLGSERSLGPLGVLGDGITGGDATGEVGEGCTGEHGVGR